MRPVSACEVARFDELLDEHHWLGRGQIGETMRHVALIDNVWVGLIGYGSCALTYSVRERFIGWSPSIGYRRLRFIAK